MVYNSYYKLPCAAKKGKKNSSSTQASTLGLRVAKLSLINVTVMLEIKTDSPITTVRTGMYTFCVRPAHQILCIKTETAYE